MIHNRNQIRIIRPLELYNYTYTHTLTQQTRKPTCMNVFMLSILQMKTK